MIAIVTCYVDRFNVLSLQILLAWLKREDSYVEKYIYKSLLIIFCLFVLLSCTFGSEKVVPESNNKKPRN